MSNSNRNHGLDLLRFLAISFVLLLHAGDAVSDMPEIFHGIFRFGWTGVDIFFVLSGFLIGRQVFEEPESRPLKDKLRLFWMKRWFRTLPLYYVVLFAYVVVKPLLGFPFKDWNWSFLIFTQNYFEPKDFIQTWSLCIEEQFYLIFPVLAFVFNLRFKNALVWVVPLLISFSLRFWAWWSGDLSGLNKPQTTYAVDFLTHLRMDGLSMGILLAATFDLWRKWKISSKVTLGISGLLLLVVTLVYSGPYAMNGDAVYIYTVLSLCFASILIGIYEVKLPEMIHLPILKIAEWSYGIYLWNNLFIRFIVKLGTSTPWWIRTLLFLGLSIFTAAITFYCVEKTFLKIRNNRLRKYLS